MKLLATILAAAVLGSAASQDDDPSCKEMPMMLQVALDIGHDVTAHALELEPAATSEFNDFPLGCFYVPGSPHLKDSSKAESMDQANLTCKDISFYGAFTAKLTGSTVSQGDEVRKSSVKRRMFNFQGSAGFGKNPLKRQRRSWALDFAKSHFTADDFLKLTDAPADYTPLGAYDHSIDLASNVSVSDTHTPDFDATFYKIMADSVFTLAPGGDNTWSMRFYEAILAGSIPVIKDPAQDSSDHSPAGWYNHVGYTYFTVEQLSGDLQFSSSELQRVADENYRLFRRYQTWVEGDNVPAAYSSYSAPCASNRTCASLCDNDSAVHEWNSCEFEQDQLENGPFSVIPVHVDCQQKLFG